jgi:hypothetical protein
MVLKLQAVPTVTTVAGRRAQAGWIRKIILYARTKMVTRKAARRTIGLVDLAAAHACR